MRKSENDAMTSAQKIALISIYAIILLLLPPKVVNKSVPITGEKKIGVKKETPNSP